MRRGIAENPRDVLNAAPAELRGGDVGFLRRAAVCEESAFFFFGGVCVGFFCAGFVCLARMSPALCRARVKFFGGFCKKKRRNKFSDAVIILPKFFCGLFFAKKRNRVHADSPLLALPAHFFVRCCLYADVAFGDSQRLRQDLFHCGDMRQNLRRFGDD